MTGERRFKINNKYYSLFGNRWYSYNGIPISESEIISLTDSSGAAYSLPLITYLWSQVSWDIELPNGADFSSGGGSGSGDMMKITYDTNDDGIVDNAEKIGGLTVSQLPLSDAAQTALANKMDKIVTATSTDQVYTKSASGNQTMTNINVLPTENTLPIRGTNGTLQVGNAINDNDAINLSTLEDRLETVSQIQLPELFKYGTDSTENPGIPGYTTVTSNILFLSKTPSWILEIRVLTSDSRYTLEGDDYTLSGNQVTINDPVLTDGMKIKVIYVI